MPIYLNASNCLLFLSKYEGSPNLIRDACACNLPIISNDVGDVKEILDQINYKLLLEKNKEININKIIEFVKTVKKTNSRNLIINNYSIKKITEKKVNYFLNIIKKKNN
jgi:Glycosyltransferase